VSASAVRAQFDALVGRSRIAAPTCSIRLLQHVANDSSVSLATRYAARALLAIYVAQQSPPTFEDDPAFWRRRAYSLVLRALALIERIGVAIIALFGAIVTLRHMTPEPHVSAFGSARCFHLAHAPPSRGVASIVLRC
jgi:hypothetical protein